jgi:hypothetical protein
MKSSVLVIFASLVAIGLWLAPTSFAAKDSQDIRSDEGAYRMRMCELALFSGESAQRDRMLEPRAGQAVPYGPFAPAASAFVLARALPRETFDIEHGTLDEDAFAGGARRLFLVLAWIGVLALAFIGQKIAENAQQRERPRDWSLAVPWIAALAWTMLALAPSTDGGSVRAPVWGLILGAINLWGAVKLARPGELIDQVGIAIGVGAITGLALLNDPFAWPGLLAPAIGLWLSVRGAEKSVRRDALRCGMFFVASTLAVFGLSSTWPGGASPWPQFAAEWQVHSGVIADPCIQGVSLMLIGWLVFAAPAGAARRALCAVLVASLVLRTIDPRFAAAPLAPAGCAFVAWATTICRAETGRAPRIAATAGLALLLVLGASFSDCAQYSDEAIESLRELRESTPSSGAWNHAAAPQSYALLANPGSAGAIAFHARRPSCGARLPGADVTPAVRAAVDALLCDSTVELAARASALNAPYVIATERDVGPFMDLSRIAGRPEGAGRPATRSDDPTGGVMSRLLVEDEVPGLELIRRVPKTLGSGELAEIAIWRVVAPAHELPAAIMRAR